MDQIRSCVFDLETTNLSADFGVILCGVVKPSDKPCKVFRADKLNKHWATRRSDDSQVILEIVKELAKYDIWIAHNGNRFDLPFLRTRLLRHNAGPLPSTKLVDPVLLARNKLRMNYNSLDSLASHLRCNSKTEVDPGMWLTAALDGDRKAMNYIVHHCVQDCITLENIASKLKVYSTTFNTYGSAY
jgi:DNA polymerase III epsilon subunit-like protein